ncbi:MAG: hypothetical protein ACLP5H_19340 [Desulfomonilaceae bacterium]
MNANAFREDELVTRKMKVNGEWQSRTFPVVGGRLRILHENNDHLGIQTEIIRLDNDFVVVKAAVESQRGKFNGTGTASGQRDAKLADSLVELAETRAIARALRFSGIGVEFTSFEEVAHVGSAAEPEKEQTGSKVPLPVFPGDNGKEKNQKSKPSSDGIDPAATGETRAPSGAAAGTGSKPQPCGIGQATQAQCRALYALTKRANYQEPDIGELLARFDVSRFEDLSREDASRLISHLQTELAA